MNRISVQYLGFILFAALLAGCSPPAPQAPAATPVPSLTPVPPSPAPTPRPSPTMSSGPPVKAPVPAHAPADVIGFWKTHYPAANIDLTLEFRPDGTFDLNEIGASGHPVDKFEGTYNVSDGQLILDADRCNKWIAAGQVEYFHCQGIYEVYSSLQGDTPVKLRFVLIEDGDPERAGWFMDRTLYLVTP
jgi:hypothetical protein